MPDDAWATERPRRCCGRRGAGIARGSIVEPVILAALARTGAHGYDLVRTIEVITGGSVTVDLGGMYRALRRLEDEGAVVSTWVDAGAGPNRREYRLTAEGVALLAHWLGHLEERQRVLATIAERVRDALEALGSDERASQAVCSEG